MPEGNIPALASMFAESRDINSFGKLLRMMQWINHCVLWQIDHVVVPFCVLFWFLLFAFFLHWRNASLAGRFAGCRGLLVFVVVCWFYRFACSNGYVLVQISFSAYAHVRTEPLARHRPHSRKKN